VEEVYGVPGAFYIVMAVMVYSPRLDEDMNMNWKDRYR